MVMARTGNASNNPAKANGINHFIPAQRHEHGPPAWPDASHEPRSEFSWEQTIINMVAISLKYVQH